MAGAAHDPPPALGSADPQGLHLTDPPTVAVRYRRTGSPYPPPSRRTWTPPPGATASASSAAPSAAAAPAGTGVATPVPRPWGPTRIPPDHGGSAAPVDAPSALSLRYWPAIDGLRGLAVVAVVLLHAGVPGFRGGFVGVDVFFVLSGFLITALLLSDLDQGGSVNLARFCARRALRIFPPLAVLLAACLAWVTLFPADAFAPGTRQGVVWAVLFVSNWIAAFNVDDLGVLAHTWSLAAEAQCYLVWAVAVAAVRLGTRRVVPVATAVAASAVVAVAVWRALAWSPGEAPSRRVYFGLDTRADAFLIGALVALVVAAGVERRIRCGRWLIRAGGAVGALLLVAAIPTLKWSAHYMYRWGGFSLVALAGGLVVLSLVTSPGAFLGGLLRWRPMVALGRISYGLYLWHFPVVVLVPPGWLGLPAAATLAFEVVVSLALAVSSRLLVERPLAQLKDRVVALRRPRVTHLAPLGAPAGSVPRPA